MAVPHRPRHHDWAVLLVAALALAGWEASGLDLVVSRHYGTPQGFPLKEAWFTAELLHRGGRWLSGVLLIAALIDFLWPRLPGPPKRERGWALVLTVAGLLAIPAVKRYTHTSCPWSLAEFGGEVPYVPHWLLGVVDGGPGHCFPSGHAVAAFCFFGLWFVWRDHRPALARALLVGVLAFGALFGWAQLARGAHYVSHTLWSAWGCFAVCVVLDGLRRAWVARRGR